MAGLVPFAISVIASRGRGARRRGMTLKVVTSTSTQAHAAISRHGRRSTAAPGMRRVRSSNPNLARDDDKPPCDWDDPEAREALVDALVRDTHAALAALDGHQLAGPLAEAAERLGLVTGQDVEQGDDGIFRIARKVACDRLISTVDAEAHHGHKSRHGPSTSTSHRHGPSTGTSIISGSIPTTS